MSNCLKCSNFGSCDQCINGNRLSVDKTTCNINCDKGYAINDTNVYNFKIFLTFKCVNDCYTENNSKIIHSSEHICVDFCKEKIEFLNSTIHQCKKCNTNISGCEECELQENHL